MEWLSLKNSLTSFLFAGLGVGIPIGVVAGLLYGLVFGLTLGVFAGLVVGFSVQYSRGGSAVIKHYALRLILWLNGYTPFKFIKFLDHCAKLIFLKKVGGGFGMKWTTYPRPARWLRLAGQSSIGSVRPLRLRADELFTVRKASGAFQPMEDRLVEVGL